MARGPKGEHHLCGVCGEWHPPHAPDNCNMVPVCKTCWSKCSINARVFAISLAKMTAKVSVLNNTIFEGIDGAILKLVEAKVREINRHNDN